MNRSEQLKQLQDIGANPAFAEKLKESSCYPLKAKTIDILQINVGKKCNLNCKHCHVSAGPERTEAMSREILEKCLEIAGGCASVSTIDITGGAPEMNPHLEWFLDQAGSLKKKLIVRSNCAILHEKEYRHFIDVYARNRVEVVTSLPDYIESKSDRQRGSGVFHNVVETIGILNRKGYAKPGSGLVLDIVHNPVGAYLPGNQASIEHEYRERLKNNYHIEFNNLFVITNIPVGRYLEYLVKTDNYYEYIDALCNAYNPHAVENVMCTTTLSVAWDGALYDCDFNQMLELPVNHGASAHIMDFSAESISNREIVINNHCYGCVAGSGSSCQGSLVKE